MPDGDRFYRRLTGTNKGWETAYRLACSNSDAVFIKDRALKAIADNFRRISSDSLGKSDKYSS